MCDSCGCTPCVECGAPEEDGVGSVGGAKPGNCTCELLDEELDYKEEAYDNEDEDPDEDEDEDEDEDDDEDEDLDDDEDEDSDEDEGEEKDW